MAVSVDADSGKKVPASAAEWSELGYTVSHLHLCQEASGNAADSVGSMTLTASTTNAPLYQQTVAGWTRKGIATTQLANQRLVAGVGVGFDPSATSFVWVGYVMFTAAAVSGRPGLGLLSGTAADRLAVSLTTAPVIRMLSGATNVVGTANPVGVVRPYVIVHEAGVGATFEKVYSDQEVLTGVYAARPDQPKGFGALGSATSAAATLLYSAVITGVAADALKSDDAIGALLTSLGFAPAWYTPPTSGVLSTSIGDVTLAAAGTVTTPVGDGSSVSGVLSASIGSITSSAAGTVAVAGSLDTSIGAITLATSSTADVGGAVDTSIGDVTLIAAATASVAGALTSSLGTIGLVAAGAVISTTAALGPAGTLIPWEPDAFTRRLSWWTDILKSHDGTEHRASLLSLPREAFDVEYTLTASQARDVRDFLVGNPAAVVHLPIRNLGVEAVRAGSAITCTTTYLDWATVGQRVIVDALDGTYFATHLVAVGVGSLTLAASSSSVPEGTCWLSPVAPAYLDGRASSGWYPVGAGTWSIAARAIVPLAALGTGGAAPGAEGSPVETLLARPLLPATIVEGETIAESLADGSELIDEGGLVEAGSGYTVADVQRGYFVRAAGDAERQAWLRVLRDLRGRQVAFYAPTGLADLTPMDWGDELLTVEGTRVGDLAAWAASLIGRILLAEVDGEPRILFVDDANVSGDDVELAVSGTGADADLEGAELGLVSFVELCRLASDEVAMMFEEGGRVSLDLPIMATQQ